MADPGEDIHDTDVELLWSKEQVARALAVSVRTVSRLINQGELPVVRIGRSVRIPCNVVREWVSRRTRQAHNGPCAGSAVRKGDRKCHISAKTARTGGCPSPTQAAQKLDALLGL